jgi:2-polyprenyl-3-methyl-5-hydroxy-6-metoxy-1,4-benzoquinol methylase
MSGHVRALMARTSSIRRRVRGTLKARVRHCILRLVFQGMPRPRRERFLFRFLFRLARLFDLAGRGLSALAVGTLQRTDLEYMSSAAWEQFGSDGEVAAAGLMGWERTVFEEFLKPADRILIVGAGSGRDLLALRKAGHDVVGVEPSSVPVERAKRLLRDHGFSVDIVPTRFGRAELPGTFDVIVFSWLCYSYILGSAERRATLAKARAHLNPNGRIVISYIEVDAPQASRGVAVARFSSRLTGADWRPEPNDSFAAVVGREPLYAYQHSFAPGELQEEALAAGLAVLTERRFPEAFVMVLSRDVRS